MSKVIEFVVENFKKIRVVEIRPDGKPVIQITGKNGQGKSSVIDALWFAIKGQLALPKRKLDAIRNGAESLKVAVKLGNGKNQTFTVTRRLGRSGNPPTLAIVPAVHEEAGKTPQQYLDDLFSALTFDPLEFVRMSTAEQVAELKRTANVGLDFEKLAEERDADYKVRHDLGREVDFLKKQLKQLPTFEGLPKEKIDTAPIVKKLNEAGELNRKAQETFAAKQRLGSEAAQLVVEEQRKLSEIETQRKTILMIEQELKAAKTKLESLQEEAKKLAQQKEAKHKAFGAAPAGELVDVGALTAELQSAERTNRAIEQRAEYDRLNAQLEKKQREYDTVDRRMEAREERKREALAKAKIPVEGLAFDESRVTFKGIPIEELGEGEQIRISTLIGMAANPKLRILCIRHGEALDEDGLKIMADLAKANDFQIWMARVDSSGKVGIVLEDGSVVARNED